MSTPLRAEEDTRLAEVWRRLGDVYDPELDETVTELNFVSGVEIDQTDHVRIDFRLPTYWCSPNFAFIMAHDMHEAVSGLPWVAKVSVTLCEHMYADTINGALADGRSFEEAFGEQAHGDLSVVRRTFLVKAFQRRQEVLLDHLMKAMAMAPARIAALSMKELRVLELDAIGRRLVEHYLARRDVVGRMLDDDLAFVDSDDAPLQAETLRAYVSGIARIRLNGEFNGHICRRLLEIRFDLDDKAPRD